MNLKGADGRTLTCISCGSYRHLLPTCPHSWENMQANVVEIDNSDEEGKKVEDVRWKKSNYSNRRSPF